MPKDAVGLCMACGLRRNLIAQRLKLHRFVILKPYYFNITVMLHTNYCSCINFATIGQLVLCVLPLSAFCRQQLDTVLSVSYRRQLDTEYQQILVATKFGVYQMKNM